MNLVKPLLFLRYLILVATLGFGNSVSLRTPFGERAFSILLFQDLSIIPLITIVAALSRNPADEGGMPGWMLGLVTLASIIGLIAAGRFLLRPLFRLIAGMGEREMFVVAALFTVIASAALMHALGLSAALGAFIAGVMLADTPYRHELEADIEPFRSILLGLFFASCPGEQFTFKLDCFKLSCRCATGETGNETNEIDHQSEEEHDGCHADEHQFNAFNDHAGYTSLVKDDWYKKQTTCATLHDA